MSTPPLRIHVSLSSDDAQFRCAGLIQGSVVPHFLSSGHLKRSIKERWVSRKHLPLPLFLPARGRLTRIYGARRLLGAWSTSTFRFDRCITLVALSNSARRRRFARQVRRRCFCTVLVPSRREMQ